MSTEGKGLTLAKLIAAKKLLDAAALKNQCHDYIVNSLSGLTDPHAPKGQTGTAQMTCKYCGHTLTVPTVATGTCIRFVYPE